jgi:hypothetical protein
LPVCDPIPPPVGPGELKAPSWVLGHDLTLQRPSIDDLKGVDRVVDGGRRESLRQQPIHKRLNVSAADLGKPQRPQVGQ